MKKFKLNRYKRMGVINVTPNSFSDGGINLNSKILQNNLNYMMSFKDLIIDLGFESTAPFNKSISVLEERNRFNFFLDNCNNFRKLKIISIDTYKIENMIYFYERLKEKNKKITVIINDVSGVLEDNLFEILKKLPDVYYVFSATRIKNRKKIHYHMDFEPSKRDIKLEVKEQFLNAINLFSKYGLSHQLILDPGFGFSKSVEENWELINNFEIIIDEIDHPVIVGLSKKSFLRAKIKSDDPKNDSEFIHYELIQELKEKKKNLIFRIHDPLIFT
jgi:dihydropteroate synthase